MALRWDALLVHHFARELHGRLAGARLRALRLDGAARDAALLFREATLLWRLHPTRGWPLLLEPSEPVAGDIALAAKVRRVRAPADERLVVLELLPARRAPHDVVIELMDNQWNVVVVEKPSDTIRHVLRRRGGRRPLAVGATYAPPEPAEREGADGALADSRWKDLAADLFAAPEKERRRRVVSRVAWTSPLNAPAVLVAAEAGAGAPAFLDPDRSDPEPVLLETEDGLQPYPFPLPGAPSRPADSLLEAFAEAARAAEGTEAEAEGALLPPGMLEALEAATEHAHRRAASLEGELAGADDPAAQRALGDLLLARYADVPGGVSEIELTDFEGHPVRVSLDPAKAVHENAEDYYERARRADRALQRLPALLERARAKATELESLLERARRGEADAEELRRRLPERPSRPGAKDEGLSLPYRSYRSSGGLEIRVGRGARHNDDLTFRHSAPGDVWLHARDAAGAHVVLRWPGPGNPPERDLHEAAVLAALGSKARTSTTAPVDWTFRKYVRKPRGAGPGRVVIEREKTVFVRPDPAMEERLRGEEG